MPKKSQPKRRRNRPPLHKHGELTMADVEWFTEHSYLPEGVIETLAEVVTTREEARSGA